MAEHLSPKSDPPPTLPPSLLTLSLSLASSAQTQATSSLVVLLPEYSTWSHSLPPCFVWTLLGNRLQHKEVQIYDFSFKHVDLIIGSHIATWQYSVLHSFASSCSMPAVLKRWLGTSSIGASLVGMRFLGNAPHLPTLMTQNLWGWGSATLAFNKPFRGCSHHHAGDVVLLC